MIVTRSCSTEMNPLSMVVVWSPLSPWMTTSPETSTPSSGVWPGRMPELAVDRAGADHAGLPAPDSAVGRDQFDLQ